MKKVLLIMSLSLAIMLISAVAVFAAGTITGVTPPPAQVVASGDVVITAVAPTTVDQITVIVYKGATASESSIAYIDQQPNTTGSVTFTFKMRSSDLTYTSTDGIYTIKVGGTDVATPDSAKTVDYILATPVPTPVQFTLSGTVTSVGDPSVPVTVTILDAQGATAKTVTSDGAGAYSAQLNAGTYTVVLSKIRHLTRTMTGVAGVAGGTVNVGRTDMMGGDVDSSEFVNDDDFYVLSQSWYLGDGDAGFLSDADVDFSGFVNDDDFYILSQNWYKGSEDYQPYQAN